MLDACSACSDRDRPHASEPTDRTPRVLDPPPANVRALPPHAIRADGVGPYRLGLTLEQLGTQVPSGGRNAQVDIPGVVHLSVLHAEEDALQIGGEPLGRASFVAVVGPKVARTESGIQVGSTRDELTHALGPPAVELDRARDPHVVVPGNLRELRAVLEGDRVIGLVVAPTEPAAKLEGCVRPVPRVEDTDKRDSLGYSTRFGACVTGAPDLVSFDGDEMIVRAVEGDKLVDKPVRIPNAVFVAPARAADGRDELVAITSTGDTQVRTWSLIAYRYETGHLLPIAQRDVYQLTATNARWIGSALRDLDLVLEVVDRAETFEVGGLLTRRSGDKLRDLLVLSTVQVPRKHAKSATPEQPSDAGVAPAAPTPGSDDVRGAQ
jgi:hypothetical protein